MNVVIFRSTWRKKKPVRNDTGYGSQSSYYQFQIKTNQGDKGCMYKIGPAQFHKKKKKRKKIMKSIISFFFLEQSIFYTLLVHSKYIYVSSHHDIRVHILIFYFNIVIFNFKFPLPAT